MNDVKNIERHIIGRQLVFHCHKEVVVFSPISRIGVGVIVYEVFIDKVSCIAALSKCL